MMLIKGKQDWTVYDAQYVKTIEPFASVDAACDFLMDTMKVPDEEIDQALIALTVSGDNCAVFTPDGEFQITKFDPRVDLLIQ